jgi:hypothetical protein
MFVQRSSVLKLSPLELGEYPGQLEAAEQSKSKNPGGKWRVGVALSGGGIRSATLSLGIFQALARNGLLRHVHYLSTVSGGGYFGSFLGKLYRREHLNEVAPDTVTRALQDSPQADKDDLVQAILSETRSAPLRLLRENGRYLAPRGAPDMLLAVGVALRNWTALHVVMGFFALAALSLLALIRYGVASALPDTTATSVVLLNHIWFSPYLIAAGAALLVFAFPPGWAYWLARDLRQKRALLGYVVRWTPVLAIAALGIGWWLRTVSLGRNALEWMLIALGALAAITVVRYLGASLRVYLQITGQGGGGKITPDDHTAALRRKLSLSMTRGLTCVAALLVIGLVDTAGQSLLLLGYRAAIGTVSVYAIVAAIVVALRPWVARFLERWPSEARPALSRNLTVHLAATMLLLLLLAPVAALVHWIAWGNGVAWVSQMSATSATAAVPGPTGTLWYLQLTAIAAVVLSLFMGRVWQFVNRSSLHPLYEARLRRAYMGASNPARTRRGQNEPPITQVHPEDGATVAQYYLEPQDGPLHIINLTLNRTVGGRSQIESKDRKGLIMAVGPGGVTVGRQHHATWGKAPVLSFRASLEQIGSMFRFGKQRTEASDTNPFRVFFEESESEVLDIGQWVALSGAAFSTGLGSRTNIGLSFLAGLFNVRLGYWWHSALNPPDRPGRSHRTWPRRLHGVARSVLPVQMAILDEWTARFPGVESAHWYLSDGGHFENMGAYELVRRKLPFIVVCDNEQDASYTFSGLANLVRKVRIDFGAEIEFLDDHELGDLQLDQDLAQWIRPLDMLRRGRWAAEPVPTPATDNIRAQVSVDPTRLSLAHAALAKITYAKEPGEQGAKTGLLLYIKPTLVGDEPIDVLQYHSDHPAFPQETTADQFFDEAQWESYRRLGVHIARKLFRGGYEGWSPHAEMRGST